MTVSRIASKLYQGGVPEISPQEIRAAGFRTVVFCAVEAQPPSEAQALLPGVELIRCPFGDNEAVPLEPSTLTLIERTATRVACRVKSGERTLVTCYAGRNRSGLVTALALTKIYGCSGEAAVTWVRRRRNNALLNARFVEYLRAIKARPGYVPPPEQPLIFAALK